MDAKEAAKSQALAIKEMLLKQDKLAMGLISDAENEYRRIEIEWPDEGMAIEITDHLCAL